MFQYRGIRFHWLGHDGFRLEAMIAGGSDRTIYFDPYQLTADQRGRNDADVIFISHDHFDHLSIDDLRHVVGKSNKRTTIVAARECEGKLNSIRAGEIKAVKPGDRLTAQGLQVEAVASYNTNKTFHPKADGKVGYVVSVNNVRIYHAGDTDIIPEMSSTNPEVALVPISGTYVMTAEEAARAVNESIRPKVAIPMHYGSIVGSEKDAEKFKNLVKVCPVEILKRE